MKLAPLLFAGSVAINLVLLGVVVHRSTRPPQQSPPGTPLAVSSAESSAIAAENTTAARAWSAIASDDLATFTANLRAAGLPEPLVRGIITAALEEQFRAREEKLSPPRPPLKYWQFDRHREPLETRLALLDLKREKARLRLELLGPDAREQDDGGIIPPVRRAIAQMITEDYDTVIRELRETTGNMPLPAEAAMLASLEEDKKRELATLLSPPELAEYEMRQSWTMKSLQSQLSTFAPTEAEFRAIHAAREEQQQWNNRTSVRRSSDFADQQTYMKYLNEMAVERRERERQSEARLRSTLGDERYIAYLRERDAHLHQVRGLVDRIGLPRETAERVYDLRASAASESVRIGQDYSRSLEERKAALREVAAQVRAGAHAMLGAAGAEAYLQSAADWLRSLEQGNTVEFQPNGWSTRGISVAPPPATL